MPVTIGAIVVSVPASSRIAGTSSVVTYVVANSPSSDANSDRTGLNATNRSATGWTAGISASSSDMSASPTVVSTGPSACASAPMIGPANSTSFVISSPSTGMTGARAPAIELIASPSGAIAGAIACSPTPIASTSPDTAGAIAWISPDRAGAIVVPMISATCNTIGMIAPRAACIDSKNPTSADFPSPLTHSLTLVRVWSMPPSTFPPDASFAAENTPEMMPPNWPNTAPSSFPTVFMVSHARVKNSSICPVSCILIR